VHHSSFLLQGFYCVWPQTGSDMLVVGPYQGTLGCLRIPFSRGVCGAAAQTQQTQLVPDVHSFEGHIACASRWGSDFELQGGWHAHSSRGSAVDCCMHTLSLPDVSCLLSSPLLHAHPVVAYLQHPVRSCDTSGRTTSSSSSSSSRLDSRTTSGCIPNSAGPGAAKGPLAGCVGCGLRSPSSI
jgi:hypothetical protein